MLKAFSSSKFVKRLIPSLSALVVLVPIGAQGQQNTSVINKVGSDSAADFKNVADSIEPHQEINFRKLDLLPSQPTPLFEINVPMLCFSSAQERAEEQKRDESEGIIWGTGSKCPNKPQTINP